MGRRERVAGCGGRWLAMTATHQPILRPLSWPYLTRPAISGNLELMTGLPFASCCVPLTPFPQLFPHPTKSFPDVSVTCPPAAGEDVSGYAGANRLVGGREWSYATPARHIGTGGTNGKDSRLPSFVDASRCVADL